MGYLLGIIFVIAVVIINSPRFKGKKGEQIVARKLETINCYSHILKDVMINDNGKSRQIDHIAISEYGVFIIETKNYGGNIYGNENSTEWKQYLGGNSYKFKNPIHQNYGHIQIVKKILEGTTEEVYPIVVFIGRCNLKIQTSSPVMYHNALKRYIENRKKVLTREQIDEIYNIINENLITNKETIRNHNYNVKKYVEYKENVSENGKCPRCNGQLVLKKGKYGKFMACNNYPKCRYTKQI